MRTLALALGAIAIAACGRSAIDAADGGTSADDASLGTDATTASSDASDLDDSSSDASDASSSTPPTDASDASADASVPCYANDDCVSGTCQYAATVCTGNDCVTSSACPGTCVPFAGDGGFCLGNAPPACDPDSGLTCDPFSHQCVPPSQQVVAVVDAGGDLCGFGVADCSSGLFCYAPVFPDNGICEPIAGDGGACDPINPFGGCAAGLVCAGFGSSLDAGVCRPPSLAGEGCVTGAAGEGNAGCVSDTLCIDGGCAALPSTGTCLEGQCDPDAGYCDSAANTCAPWVPNGAACTASTQCASHLCASTTSTCVTSLPIGAACGSAPYDCTKGVCSTYLGCASGICDVTGHCAASMCPRDAGP